MTTQERRPILLGDWHPVANFLLALAGLIGCVWFGTKGDTQSAILCLIITALCI